MAETVPRESTQLSRALLVEMAAVPVLVAVAVMVAPADAPRVRALPVLAVLPVRLEHWAMPVTADVALTATRERQMADVAATAVQVAARASQEMVAPAEMALLLSRQVSLAATVELAAPVARMRPASLVSVATAVPVALDSTEPQAP